MEAVMSNAIFPDLPGLAWPIGKTPRFSNKTQTSASLREVRARMAVYPIYDIKLTFEFLREDEWRLLGGFFLQRAGSFESFLFEDKHDCSVVDQALGIGDGSRTQWQLVRDFGGFVEPCENIKTIGAIKVGGVVVPPSGYTITSTGLLALVSPPAAGQSVSWSGGYYYRCRFGADTAEFEEFMRALWQLKTLTMVGATGNKV